jgi:hypothetical protein
VRFSEEIIDPLPGSSALRRALLRRSRVVPSGMHDAIVLLPHQREGEQSVIVRGNAVGPEGLGLLNRV